MKLGNIVWEEFCNKMREGTLSNQDFSNEMQLFLASLLCGDAAKQRCDKYLSSPFEIYDRNEKVSVLVHCTDDDYRFDFVWLDNRWKLAFLECITLPVSDIQTLPYREFIELPKKETEIRREKEISQTVFLYNKFKELIGKEQAIKMFLDGDGEAVCGRSWVPFYSGPLSYIAYAAWIENRIHGEKVIIEQFDDEACCIRFQQHIWRQMYAMTGHLQSMIDYAEYMELFEAIWLDRARAAGWKVWFEYLQEDTVLRFERE